MIYPVVRELAADGIPDAVACRVLEVSTSGYYEWDSRPASARAWEQAHLMNTIIEVHAASYGTYGHRRVRAELVLGQQVEVSHGRVERLMRWTGPQELNAQLSSHDQLVGVAIERAEGILVEDLQGHGHRLFCVSPKMSALARERYRMAPTKSDSFDAFVLADMLVPRCSLISTTSVVSNTVFVPPVNNPPVRRGSPPPIGSV